MFPSLARSFFCALAVLCPNDTTCSRSGPARAGLVLMRIQLTDAPFVPFQAEVIDINVQVVPSMLVVRKKLGLMPFTWKSSLWIQVTVVERQI